MNLRSIENLLRGLRAADDGELEKSRDLVAGLLSHTGQPISRNQFDPGHITCTGLVFSPAGDEILIVHHCRLDRWLLPGGHVEREDVEIWDAARREVIEETGAELEDNRFPPLAGIDVHPIPPGKGEPYHLHHDLLFAFRARSKEFRLSSESREIAWATEEQFAGYDLPRNIRRAYFRSRPP